MKPIPFNTQLSKNIGAFVDYSLYHRKTYFLYTAYKGKFIFMIITWFIHKMQ